MVGDSADTQQPKHTTFASLMSWVKTKLGHTTITPGNIPVLATDGTLADSNSKPSDFEKLANKVTATSDTTSEVQFFNVKGTADYVASKTLTKIGFLTYDRLNYLDQGLFIPQALGGITLPNGHRIISVQAIGDAPTEGVTQTALCDDGTIFYRCHTANSMVWSEWIALDTILYLSRQVKNEGRIYYIGTSTAKPGVNMLKIPAELFTAQGTLLELKNFEGKISFWCTAVRKDGNSFPTDKELKNTNAYIIYKLNGVETACPIYIAVGGIEEQATAYDIIGKQITVMFKGAFYYSCMIENGTKRALVTTTTKITDSTPIILNSTNQTYTITGAEASDKIVTASDATGANKIILPTLTSNFSTTLHISSDSELITIVNGTNETTYQAGEDVNVSWNQSTSTWRIVSYDPPVATDYTHAVADYAAAVNIPITSVSAKTFVVAGGDSWSADGAQAVDAGTIVLLANQNTKSECGLYKIVSESGTGNGGILILKLSSGEEILTCRVKGRYDINDLDQGAYQNEYDGSNPASIKFEKLSDKLDTTAGYDAISHVNTQLLQAIGTTHTSLENEIDGRVSGLQAELSAKADLVNGLIPSSQLPSYVDDVVELLNITGTVPATPAEADKYFDPATSKIQTYTSSAWVATTPEAGKIYVSTDTNNQYRWSGTGMIQITNTIDFATQAEAEVASPTENTKTATLLRVFQGFKYWLQNTVINTLTTTAQTIVGAINELKSSKANAGANSDITSLTGLTTPLDVTEGGTGSATKNFVDLTTNQSITNCTKTISNTTATIQKAVSITGSYANTGADYNYKTPASIAPIVDIKNNSTYIQTTPLRCTGNGNGMCYSAVFDGGNGKNTGGGLLTQGSPALTAQTATGRGVESFATSGISVYGFSTTGKTAFFEVQNESGTALVLSTATQTANSRYLSLMQNTDGGGQYTEKGYIDGNASALFTQVAQTIQTLIDATTITWNAALGANALLTLTDAVTTRTISNITNLVAGTTYQIFITQSPNATYPAVGWDTLYKFPSSITPNLNSAAGGVTCLEFFYTGTSLRLKNLIAY
jgi:hypothetical protein